MTAREATVRRACLPRLRQLINSAGIYQSYDGVAALFDALTGPWGGAAPSTLASSDVSPDGSPVEFALDLGRDAASVQIAVEPMVVGARDAFTDRAAAARSTMARLEHAYGVPTGRWDAIEPVFLPETGGRQHAAMFGADVKSAAPPTFKVWLYPGVTGPEHAPDLVREGLRRLGLGAAWSSLVSHAPRGFERDVPVLFALDLVHGRRARTKIYFRHYHLSPDDLARQLARYPGFDERRVRAFSRALAGDPQVPAAQPPVTCVSFRGADAVPDEITLYVPLWADLADDEEIRRRIRGLLLAEDVDPARYDNALLRVATRPLGRVRGVHNYLSWQPRAAGPRMKVYWSPELRGVDPSPRYLQGDVRMVSPHGG